jgi:hypothetical protein
MSREGATKREWEADPRRKKHHAVPKGKKR